VYDDPTFSYTVRTIKPLTDGGGVR